MNRFVCVTSMILKTQFRSELHNSWRTNRLRDLSKISFVSHVSIGIRKVHKVKDVEYIPFQFDTDLLCNTDSLHQTQIDSPLVGSAKYISTQIPKATISSQKRT